MALPTASDNAFPSLLVTEGSAPSSPAAGKQRVYIDSADHRLKRKNSSGTVVAIDAGSEIDYVQITTGVNPTNTSEGTADTIITGTSITYDGNTTVMVECFTPQTRAPSSASSNMYFVLLDGATVLGLIGELRTPSATSAVGAPLTMQFRVTPSAAAHQFIVKAYVSTGTGIVGAGSGGTGNLVPAFLRVTRV